MASGEIWETHSILGTGDRALGTYKRMTPTERLVVQFAIGNQIMSGNRFSYPNVPVMASYLGIRVFEFNKAMKGLIQKKIIANDFGRGFMMINPDIAYHGNERNIDKVRVKWAMLTNEGSNEDCEDNYAGVGPQAPKGSPATGGSHPQGARGYSLPEPGGYVDQGLDEADLPGQWQDASEEPGNGTDLPEDERGFVPSRVRQRLGDALAKGRPCLDEG